MAPAHEPSPPIPPPTEPLGEFPQSIFIAEREGAAPVDPDNDPPPRGLTKWVYRLLDAVARVMGRTA